VGHQDFVKNFSQRTGIDQTPSIFEVEPYYLLVMAEYSQFGDRIEPINVKQTTLNSSFFQKVGKSFSILVLSDESEECYARS
jgi:hypothetical protein